MTATVADRARQLGVWLDVERARARPFDWRDNNCCQWADRWVQMATGRAVLYPGAATVVGPMAARRRVPLGLPAHVSALWGCDALAASLAQVGDVLLMPVPDGIGLRVALGVCGGRVGWVQDEATGLPVALAMSEFTLCWPLAGRRPQALAA